MSAGAPQPQAAEPKRYRFSTLQELVDRVPADRIATCLHEIGIGLGQAKGAAELMLHAAAAMAEQMGVQCEVAKVTSLVELPPVLEWVDDGLGEVQTKIVAPEHPELGLTLEAKLQPEDPRAKQGGGENGSADIMAKLLVGLLSLEVLERAERVAWSQGYEVEAKIIAGEVSRRKEAQG